MSTWRFNRQITGVCILNDWPTADNPCRLISFASTVWSSLCGEIWPEKDECGWHIPLPAWVSLLCLCHSALASHSRIRHIRRYDCISQWFHPFFFYSNVVPFISVAMNPTMWSLPALPNFDFWARISRTAWLLEHGNQWKWAERCL